MRLDRPGIRQAAPRRGRSDRHAHGGRHVLPHGVGGAGARRQKRGAHGEGGLAGGAAQRGRDGHGQVLERKRDGEDELICRLKPLKCVGVV